MQQLPLGVRIPDRAVFEHVAEALGSAPGRILFLDDNRLNVEQAASVGIVAHRVAGVQETAALMLELGLLEEGEFRPAAVEEAEIVALPK